MFECEDLFTHSKFFSLNLLYLTFVVFLVISSFLF